jgi:hypothetical protein
MSAAGSHAPPSPPVAQLPDLVQRLQDAVLVLRVAKEVPLWLVLELVSRLTADGTQDLTNRKGLSTKSKATAANLGDVAERLLGAVIAACAQLSGDLPILARAHIEVTLESVPPWS